jgi:hypothetical protein
MRRGLTLAHLGDLFDLPRTAVISIGLADGSVFSRPVWHRLIDGRFVFQFPAGDRKIPMLERDPRATVVLAEDAFPYRAIEVRGRMTMSPDRYQEIAAAICRPYVEAFAPGADVAAYLSDTPGMIGVLEAEVTTCWDYADEAAMMSPGIR